MSTKNKTEEIKTEEIKTEEIKTEEIKTEETVTIKLPRIKGESDSVYVSINERNWLIKRGVSVDVPKCVAELIDQQEKAIEEAYNRKEAARNASKQ